MRLKRYNQFKDDTLHIFDFDDTLVSTPKIEDHIIKLLKESTDIKPLLMKMLSQINREIKDLQIDNGRIYVEDPNTSISIDNTTWVRKGRRVYLTTPSEYHFTELSRPIDLTKIGEFYNTVKNRAIVTARNITQKEKVIEYLTSFGLKNPNYGLFCHPGKVAKLRPPEWKAKVIIELINKHGFEKVIFYEDNSKNIRIVRREVNKNLPNIEFTIIKV